MSPEAKVKQAVKQALAQVRRCYPFWPVQQGLGATTLDCLVCAAGRFIAIETKAPGKKLTPRQRAVGERIAAAGGIVYVIDSVEDAKQLPLAIESYVRHNSVQSE